MLPFSRADYEGVRLSFVADEDDVVDQLMDRLEPYLAAGMSTGWYSHSVHREGFLRWRARVDHVTDGLVVDKAFRTRRAARSWGRYTAEDWNRIIP